MKMTDWWLYNELDTLSKFDIYSKPKKIKDALKLDANENLVLNKDLISEIALSVLKSTDLREYPREETEEALYRSLAEYTGVDKRYLAIGNGSDQIIDLILSTIGKNRRCTIFTPTFSYFITRCELHGIVLDRVALNKEDNTVDKLDFLKSAMDSDMVYICSPNNPTGNQFDREFLLEIIKSLTDKLILFDEAYVEFANYTLISYISKNNNIVLLRTLSKAFGLAGARLGYLIANEKLARTFRSTIQSPYPLNSLSLTIASMMLSRYRHRVNETVELIKNERKRMYDHLSKINGIKVFTSDANFIFFESGDKFNSILKNLQKNRVVVKVFGDIDNRKGCMRVTVGTYEMNNKFLKSITRATS
jgi:histidinol-phosphate aminotransferase